MKHLFPLLTFLLALSACATNTLTLPSASPAPSDTAELVAQLPSPSPTATTPPPAQTPTASASASATSEPSLTPSLTPSATRPAPSATFTPSPTIDLLATFTPAPTPEECYEWFFPDPPPECASSPPLRSAAAVQHFEHGLLLWSAEPDKFYIFVDQPELHAFLILAAPYVLQEAEPALDTPPPDRYEPISGFGRLWNGEIDTFNVNFANLRDLLGWAIEPEYGYEFIFQCQTANSLLEERCFVSDGTGEILYLQPAVGMWGWWLPGD